jgi:hypothetical protein
MISDRQTAPVLTANPISETELNDGDMVSFGLVEAVFAAAPQPDAETPLKCGSPVQLSEVSDDKKEKSEPSVASRMEPSSKAIVVSAFSYLSKSSWIKNSRVFLASIPIKMRLGVGIVVVCVAGYELASKDDPLGIDFHGVKALYASSLRNENDTSGSFFAIVDGHVSAEFGDEGMEGLRYYTKARPTELDIANIQSRHGASNQWGEKRIRPLDRWATPDFFENLLGKWSRSDDKLEMTLSFSGIDSTPLYCLYVQTKHFEERSKVFRRRDDRLVYFDPSSDLSPSAEIGSHKLPLGLDLTKARLAFIPLVEESANDAPVGSWKIHYTEHANGDAEQCVADGEVVHLVHFRVARILTVQEIKGILSMFSMGQRWREKEYNLEIERKSPTFIREDNAAVCELRLGVRGSWSTVNVFSSEYATLLRRKD